GCLIGALVKFSPNNATGVSLPTRRWHLRRMWVCSIQWEHSRQARRSATSMPARSERRGGEVGRGTSLDLVLPLQPTHPPAHLDHLGLLRGGPTVLDRVIDIGLAHPAPHSPPRRRRSR